MVNNKIFINGSEIDADAAENISIATRAAKTSDGFEMENTELKRQYIVSNIILYNDLISMINESLGTFGTGYPFYALKTDLTGALPILDEQLRYNDELYKRVADYKEKILSKTCGISNNELNKKVADYEKELLRKFSGISNDELYKKVNDYKAEILSEFSEISPQEKRIRAENIRWVCSECLKKNSMTMPDLKKICNSCLNMDNNLKPRKLMARLPDLDMWTICKPEDIEKISKSIETTLHENGFKTSDVDPIKTITDIESIVSKLKIDKLPDIKLPIDTHIIDNITLYTLISHIPETLYNSFKNGSRPYLPILPLSLRKTWQHDDEAYNFVYDYLSAFSEFNFDDKIQEVLNETRREIAKRYSLEQLYNFMLISGNDVSRRRLKNPLVKKYFDEKVESWREL